MVERTEVGDPALLVNNDDELQQRNDFRSSLNLLPVKQNTVIQSKSIIIV